jgi:hypothetical protein
LANNLSSQGDIIDRDKIIGTWFTAHEDNIVTFTKFNKNGTFVSRSFKTHFPAFIIKGTWELAGATIVWKYDKNDYFSKRIDINEIVTFMDRVITLKEENGDLTLFRHIDRWLRNP